MALDATSRESNVKDSLKKFFVDNLFTTEGIHLTFDRSLTPPVVQGHEVEKWISIWFGAVDTTSSMAEMTFDVYCCTRKDKEGYKLSQLRDKVHGYLEDSAMEDNTKRIDFYRSRDGAWTLIGKLLVVRKTDGRDFIAPDETKVKQITVMVKWGAK